MANKEDPTKFLSDVPQEYVFWNNDGRTLKNLNELAQALATMTEGTYIYHAKNEKNDFANWVRDVIGDQKLAAELQKAQNRAQAARVVARRVALLGKKRS